MSKLVSVLTILGFTLFLSPFFMATIAQQSSIQTQQQTSRTDAFEMLEGTDLQILSNNFLTVIAHGRIIGGRLELHNALPPTQQVQLLFSNAQTGQVLMLPAVVSFDGTDLLIATTTNTNLSTSITYSSFRNFLSINNNVVLSTVTENR